MNNQIICYRWFVILEVFVKFVLLFLTNKNFYRLFLHLQKCE